MITEIFTALLSVVITTAFAMLTKIVLSEHKDSREQYDRLQREYINSLRSVANLARDQQASDRLLNTERNDALVAALHSLTTEITVHTEASKEMYKLIKDHVQHHPQT